MLLAYLTSQICIMHYETHRLNLFNQTDCSWGVHERQRFVLYVDLRRFLRHQINNEPATASRLSDASAVESSQKL